MGRPRLLDPSTNSVNLPRRIAAFTFTEKSSRNGSRRVLNELERDSSMREYGFEARPERRKSRSAKQGAGEAERTVSR